MDFIFGLITPYVEFSTNYYSNVLIICLILSVTGFIGYLHVTSAKDDFENLLGLASLLCICSFAWPIVLFFLVIILLCVFYYFLVGFLINLILKRFK